MNVGRSLIRRLMIAVLLLAALPALGDARLPRIFGSHMVLQRDRDIPVWGWADSAEKITVELGDSRAATQADDNGHWTVRLQPMKPGGPHTMTIHANNEITFEDVLIGEVWICSGQSNMEMGINSINNAEQEVAQANYPNIRLFQIPWKTAAEPLQDLDADWRLCTPESIRTGGWFNAGFSAVAYFFGREIHKSVDVPVGLIDSSWGGTRIEPWTPPAGFAEVPALKDVIATIEQATPKFRREVAEAVLQYERWLPTARDALDTGRTVPPPPTWPKHQLEDSAQPTSIYNAMIHPLVPFAIRGAIWYQGESNHPDGIIYFEKMKALIAGWRNTWEQGEFPFYFVQIAPFAKIYQNDQLPRLWEAQTKAMSIPNTGMVVTSDIADLEDIHPKNKQDVGKRLALWALANTYEHADIVCSGPIYKSMNTENDWIVIRFDHIGSGLASRDGKPLNWFTIAGKDRRFVTAQAEIDANEVMVWSDEVPEPVAVRFAWDMAAEPNLMNKEGLPASSFRTDDWE